MLSGLGGPAAAVCCNDISGVVCLENIRPVEVLSVVCRDFFLSISSFAAL